jgi:hypothetical protein
MTLHVSPRNPVDKKSVLPLVAELTGGLLCSIADAGLACRPLSTLESSSWHPQIFTVLLGEIEFTLVRTPPSRGGTARQDGRRQLIMSCHAYWSHSPQTIIRRSATTLLLGCAQPSPLSVRERQCCFVFPYGPPVVLATSLMSIGSHLRTGLVPASPGAKAGALTTHFFLSNLTIWHSRGSGCSREP